MTALSDSPARIEVRGPGGLFRLDLLSYERPAPDGVGPDWLRAEALFEVGGFRGAIASSMAAEDIASFASSLDQALAAPGSQATLRTIEDRLALEIALDRRGGATVRGRIERHGTPSARAQFCFVTDQTYLRQTAAALAAAVAAFPHRNGGPRQRE